MVMFFGKYDRRRLVGGCYNTRMQSGEDQLNSVSGDLSRSSDRVAQVTHWLRGRLLPQGEGTLMIAAYTVILAALISFVINHHDMPAWRFYTVVTGLATMFTLNVVLADIEARIGSQIAAGVHFAANGAIFLLVNWAGLGRGFTFLPFLLFILASQAFLMLRLLNAALVTAALTGGWFALFWLRGYSLPEALESAPSIGIGLVFTITLSLTLARFSEQTRRAEALAERLRVANAELEIARERERNLAAVEERLRLARDIHDGLGHHLTALHIQLQAAERLLDRDPARVAPTIALCREQAHAALSEVRRSVASMRQSPLDGRSLDAALHALVRDFNQSGAPEAHCDIHGDISPLAPAAATTIYRAAQEGLTNARKYAAARQVTIRVTFTPDTVQLSVEDDGIGERATPGDGFGLAGLRERAEQLGGAFTAGPRPEGGFRLAITLPVATAHAAQGITL